MQSSKGAGDGNVPDRLESKLGQHMEMHNALQSEVAAMQEVWFACKGTTERCVALGDVARRTRSRRATLESKSCGVVDGNHESPTPRGPAQHSCHSARDLISRAHRSATRPLCFYDCSADTDDTPWHRWVCEHPRPQGCLESLSGQGAGFGGAVDFFCGPPPGSLQLPSGPPRPRTTVSSHSHSPISPPRMRLRRRGAQRPFQEQRQDGD